MRRAPAFIAAFALVILAPALTALPSVALAKEGQVAAAAADPAKCSLTWPGFESQLEEAMVSGKITKIEDVPIGVTKPQRATLENGSRFAWKAIRPGFNKGYMESYKSEVAAYKLDRMLDMHMVPPVVERSLDGKTGAALFWIENTKGWSVAQPPRGPEPMWSLQLTRMKMFDLLIANIDRNQGNLIYDADWHLFLIDHSRAFIDKKDLKNLAPLGRVDRKLWEKMQALTMADLDAGLGDWVDNKGKKALLIRRDLMAKEITSLIAKRGEASVFY